MADSIILLPTTTFIPGQTVTPIVGVPAKGAGYFGSAPPTHTTQYVVDVAFRGTIKIQATLLELPAEDDWFEVDATSFTANDPGQAIAVVSTFVGNFVWIRAVVEPFTAGTINRIQYAHT